MWEFLSILSICKYKVCIYETKETIKYTSNKKKEKKTIPVMPKKNRTTEIML